MTLRDESDSAEQAAYHEAIETAMRAQGDLSDGELLTGWVLTWEKVVADERGSAGRIYGPPGMTTWRALGLTEYMSRADGFPESEDE